MRRRSRSPARCRWTGSGMPCRRSPPSVRCGCGCSRSTGYEPVGEPAARAPGDERRSSRRARAERAEEREMTSVSFGGLLVVALIALGAPLLVSLAPKARIPADVVAIVAGIVVGPSVLGWVRVDTPIGVLALL